MFSICAPYASCFPHEMPAPLPRTAGQWHILPSHTRRASPEPLGRTLHVGGQQRAATELFSSGSAETVEVLKKKKPLLSHTML